MTSIYLNFQGIDAATGIAADQSLPAGGGDLALNGTTVKNGIARTGSDAYISFIISSTENLSGLNFTVTGKEVSGLIRTEVVSGPNNGTSESNSWYQEIISVSVDGAIAGNIQIGWQTTDFGMFSGPILINTRQSPFNMRISATLIDGTGSFTSAFTLLDPEGDYSPRSFSEAAFPAFPIPGLTSLTASATTPIDVPVTGLFFSIGDGDGVATDHWTVQILQGQNG